MTDTRHPDFNVNAFLKSSGVGRKVGAGWINDDTSISIKLDHFVSLNAGDDLRITLFPWNSRDQEAWDRRQKSKPAEPEKPRSALDTFKKATKNGNPF